MNVRKYSLLESIEPAFWLAGAMWAVFLLDLIIPVQLNSVGIQPRTAEGLLGIVTAPFLHGGWRHIISNITPFLILSTIAFAWSRSIAMIGIVIIVLGGGFGTWLVAQSNSNHIGASGLVYGLVGFLLVGGFVRKDPWATLISIVVLVLYGAVALDAFTGIGAKPGVSWQSHLFGFLSGIGAAFMLKKEKT